MTTSQARTDVVGRTVDRAVRRSRPPTKGTAGVPLAPRRRCAMAPGGATASAIGSKLPGLRFIYTKTARPSAGGWSALKSTFTPPAFDDQRAQIAGVPDRDRKGSIRQRPPAPGDGSRVEGSGSGFGERSGSRARYAAVFGGSFRSRPVRASAVRSANSVIMITLRSGWGVREAMSGPFVRAP